MSDTIDKLKLISTLAKFQDQQRKTLQVLSCVHKLIAGWKGTTPENEWSEWDEKTFSDLTNLMTEIHNSLPPRASGQTGT